MPDLHETINNFLEGSIKTLGKTPVIESKSITANGTYTAPSGVDGYSPITVNVPVPTPVIESKSITENGTYTAPEGVDGYSPITVNVPVPTPVIESKSITENGTYTAPSGVDGYSPITVNVPLPQNAYLLKSVNTPTPIASFNDGEEMVMPTLKVAIEPQQEGSGDPSPTNIRPISGWSSVNVVDNGTNHCDGIFEQGSIANNGTNQPSTTRCRLVGYMPIKPNETYYCKSDYNTFLFFYDKNKTFIGYYANNVKNSTFKPKDLPNAVSGGDDFSNACYVRLRYDNATFEGNFSINYPSTDTDYHAYNGHTYTIDLDGTRYGGELDVVSGIVTPAPYYASYNGETLTGEWISDRDKYEVGATPTIGAQVVNIGASGTPVSILPTAVKSLRGVNNVYANTGDIADAEYFSKEG